MNIDNTVFDDKQDMEQALYACWWGNDFATNPETVELNSFDFFSDDAGYSQENRDEIANLHPGMSTNCDWVWNHYIMRVR